MGHACKMVWAALAALLAATPAHAAVRPGPDVLYAPPPRAPQLENTGPWKAPPILISGASAYRDGEFLYWIYDDYGAGGGGDPENPLGPQNHLFSPKSGSLTYPTDPVFAHNGADLVELPRVRGGRVTRAVVRHGKRRVLVRRGRNLRVIRVRRASTRSHRLRVELRTTKGKLTLTRRIAACR